MANKVTTTQDIAKAVAIDLAETFKGNIDKLVEMLGTTYVVPMSSGTTVNVYKWSEEIDNTEYAEGDVIPLSKVKQTLDHVENVKIEKKRKQVSSDEIQKSGVQVAVTETDEKLIKHMQKIIRQKLITALSNGLGTATAPNLQGALAKAWGSVQTVFEDDGVQTLAFVNPMDVADYLATDNSQVVNLFGLNFITTKTGVTCVTSTLVPQGTVYATAPQNIKCYYVDIRGELAIMNMETDESGYIGIRHSIDEANDSYQTLVKTGVMFIPENLAGVIKVTIGA